ncbi:hypothetical protein [Pyrobaculum sp.]|uniref:hypothetical protein n=1 Tax=Pyrobaculum sp. TaxID=2004705 RepID=UPI003D0BD279
MKGVRTAVLLITVIAVVFVAIYASGYLQPQAPRPPIGELEELRLFITPENGTKTSRWELCGMKIYGKGAYYKKGDIITSPIKDIEELPEKIRKDYSDPVRAYVAGGIRADKDGYIYSIYFHRPEGGAGLADKSVLIEERNITAIGSGGATPATLRVRGVEYSFWLGTVEKVTSKNATVYIVCGTDKEKVEGRLGEIRNELEGKK